MPNQLRSGIVGGGFIGGVHAYAVRAAGGRLTRVADHSPQAALEAAERMGAEAAADSSADLIAAEDVDVVHICTPNATHAPLARLALEHGKAVVCEKPLATSVGTPAPLVEAARAGQAVTAVPFVYRFHPLVREVRARIAAGEAGRVWLHARLLPAGLAVPQRRHELADGPEAGWRVQGVRGRRGTLVRSHGVRHRPADRAALRAGRLGLRGRSGTEDGAVVMFETDAGGTGSVVVSQVSPGRKNRLWFSFDGTDASYAFDQEQPDQVWVGRRDENRIVLRDPNTLEQPPVASPGCLPATRRVIRTRSAPLSPMSTRPCAAKCPTGCPHSTTACAQPPSPKLS